MKSIPLTQGKIALVDDEDYEYLNQWKWQAYRSKNTWYAQRSYKINGRKKSVSMHRLLVSAKDDKLVDHINGDGLDNRKSNLRICTLTENNHNRRINKDNHSGYKGVYWHARDKRYIAQIKVNGKQIILGRFRDAVDAAKAYDKGAIRHHGSFARLNFPENS